MRTRRRFGWWLLLALAIGCGGEDAALPGPTGGNGGQGGEGGAAEPPVASEDWCERLADGLPTDEELPLAWSAAHAHLRFFSMLPSREQVDGALTAALETLGDEPAQTRAYADHLGSETGTACAVDAGAEPLAPAEVTVEDGVAIVRPGTGPIGIPDEAEAIAIDLRDLPAGAALDDALEAATAAAFTTPLERSKTRVREHRGMYDEVFSFLNQTQNIYASQRVLVPLAPWPGDASTERPVALLTDPRLAPAAARLAIDARLAERVTLIGTGLMTTVAESRWFGIGASGVAVRDRELRDVPDRVPADRRSGDPIADAKAWLAEGAPPPAPFEPGVTERSRLVDHDVSGIQPDEQSAGAARAAATIVHGAARLFFPYFPVVGDTIDAGLSDAYSAIAEAQSEGADDFTLVKRGLFTLDDHLHDSHTWVLYMGDAPATHARVPVLLDATADGSIVVRNSELAALPAGHRVIAIDGTPIQEVIDERLPKTPASAPSALRNVLGGLRWIDSVETWTVAAPDDTTSDLSLDPSALPAPTASVDLLSTRQTGTLADLGRPDVYYVNLDGNAYDGVPVPNQIVAAAEAAGTLLLDARGYPGTSATWWLIEKLLEESTSIHFNIPMHTPFEGWMDPLSQGWHPSAPSFAGPVYVLIAPHTQSQAEHILIPLVNTGRATFVGRATAGANGNITGVMLPGSFGLTFTGMEVLFADMSTFHGIGIVPDIEAYPTVAALAAGEDPELQQALAVIP